MRPVLVQLGPVSLYSWGFMFVVALTVGTLVAVREFRKMGRDPWQAMDLALWIAIGAIVGSRLLFILIELPSYLSAPLEVFHLRAGGLSFHGGLLGGFLAGWLFARRIGLGLGQGADIAALAVCLGYSFARLGCFLTGCCYGIPTSVPWAVVFEGVLRHPTQLYAAVLNLVVFFVLYGIQRRKPFAGSLWIIYLGLYSVQRTIVEIWRDNPRIWMGLGLAQIASIIVAVLSFSLVVMIAHRHRSGIGAAGEEPKS